MSDNLDSIDLNKDQTLVLIKNPMQMYIQIFNVVSWIFCMTMNGVSAAALDESVFKTLGEITDDVDARISPAN